MNCQDFEKTVLALARNQSLTATTREQGLMHAEICVPCAARLAAERALLADIHLVVAEIAKERAPARVEAALLTAFRAQTERRDATTIRPLTAHGRWRQWRMVAAWAAVILLAVLTGVTWLKSSSDAPKQAVRQSPVKSPAPPKEVPASKGRAQVDEPKLAGASVGARPPQTRRGIRQAAAPESEIATQFFSLVEEGELASLESGRVVRVEVPFSTLIALGLPITAESSNRSVQADLLLGQDGLARAIRFLP